MPFGGTFEKKICIFDIVNFEPTWDQYVPKISFLCKFHSKFFISEVLSEFEVKFELKYCF